jgi:hypothetical protein
MLSRWEFAGHLSPRRICESMPLVTRAILSDNGMSLSRLLLRGSLDLQLLSRISEAIEPQAHAVGERHQQA